MVVWLLRGSLPLHWKGLCYNILSQRDDRVSVLSLVTYLETFPTTIVFFAYSLEASSPVVW